MKPVYYNQYNDPWDDFLYPSATHPKATVESGGCGITCFAMIRATFDDPKFTPKESAQLALALNDRGLEGTEDEFFMHAAAKYKYEFSQTKDIKAAIEALKNGKLIVCRMKDWFKLGAGHFILAWGVSGNKIQIHDPASRSNSAKLYEQSIFIKKCIGYFIFSQSKVMTVDEAVDILSKAKLPEGKMVIDSPDRWKSALSKGSLNPAYIKALIIKFAKYTEGVK
jgi:hypothetical protein